jgi:hypothetical protein
LILLDWVVELLDEEEITFSWFSQSSKHPSCVVTVNEQESLRRLLVEIAPYLTLKKDRAIEAVKFLDAKIRLREYRETHCVNGHRVTDENTYYHNSKTGYVKRHCLDCKKARRDRVAC